MLHALSTLSTVTDLFPRTTPPTLIGTHFRVSSPVGWREFETLPFPSHVWRSLGVQRWRSSRGHACVEISAERTPVLQVLAQSQSIAPPVCMTFGSRLPRGHQSVHACAQGSRFRSPALRGRDKKSPHIFITIYSHETNYANMQRTFKMTSR